ncbi:MAG: hypothetical protein KAX49_18405 [Halanaerobiales bacterium]|nr:hypothetical protein [Halanaerobiales bacterium]
MKKRLFAICFLIFALFSLTGCFGDPRIELTYDPQSFEEIFAKGATVSIAPLVDDRQDQRWVAADYNAIGNPVKTHVPAEPIETSLTTALHKHFEAAGFEVDRIAYWDLTAESIKDVASDILVGGTIKVFWAESHPDMATKNLTGWGNSTCKINVVIANPAEKRILWSGSLSSYTDRNFSAIGLFGETNNVQRILNEELKTAIDGFLRNPNVKSILLDHLK